ncbi:MAG: VOC family protein [Sneathiella sp.]
MRPFHLAFPVTDLDATRDFYVDILGCSVGRISAGEWIDFDLFEHQITAHLRSDMPSSPTFGHVDGDAVPVPHFGVIVTMEDFKALANRLVGNPDTNWVVHPRTRFEGLPGEQSTLFILDPSGNALEFKSFAQDSSIFAV